MHSLHHGQEGTVLEETGYENTYAAATAFARKARREYGKCQAVCESTGNLWVKTYEAFEDRGIPIELANPMKARAITEASVKTDKVDARTLAHLLRTNLIARCHVAERGARGVRQLLRERNNLVKARAQAINLPHNLLDRYDLNPKDFAQDIWREKALKALDSKSLADPNDDYVLHRYVRGIRHRGCRIILLDCGASTGSPAICSATFRLNCQILGTNVTHIAMPPITFSPRMRPDETGL